MNRRGWIGTIMGLITIGGLRSKTLANNQGCSAARTPGLKRWNYDEDQVAATNWKPDGVPVNSDDLIIPVPKGAALTIPQGRKYHPRRVDLITRKGETT